MFTGEVVIYGYGIGPKQGKPARGTCRMTALVDGKTVKVETRQRQFPRQKWITMAELLVFIEALKELRKAAPAGSQIPYAVTYFTSRRHVIEWIQGEGYPSPQSRHLVQLAQALMHYFPLLELKYIEPAELDTILNASRH